MKLPDIDLTDITTLQEALNVIAQLLQVVQKQQEKITVLEAEIARLKGQPKKPHFASSQKSSISVSSLLKDPSDRKKNWHKSKKRDSLPIDTHVDLPGQTICVCGSSEFVTIHTRIKIIQGMIIMRNNIAYHGKEQQCVNCKKIYYPPFPQETHGLSFDGTTCSLVSFLKFDCRMTIPLLHRFFTGFGMQISYGQLSAMLLRNSKKLLPTVRHLKAVGIARSSYTQSDATGSKRKNQRTGKIMSQHLHILGNKFLSIFAITRVYNSTIMNRLLGRQGRKKPFVSDDGSPNGECLKCKNKQLCWVHEIRLYKKLFNFFSPYHKQERKILLQWKKFYHLAKSYGHDPTEQMRKQIERQFNRITGQKTGYDLLDKQLALTRKKRDRLLLFLDFPFLPIHNNQCELDLREYVIIRKISGETKSIAGDRSIERHLSVIQTAKKQGLPVFRTLHGLLTGQLTPAILTVKSV
jgi:hypothetical protein